MLINKLIRQVLSPKIFTNPVIYMAAQKAQKPKSANKAPKEGDKAKQGSDTNKKPPAGTEKPAQQAQDMTKIQDEIMNSIVFTTKSKVGAFYRDSLRTVQVKKSTQRAQFSEVNFLRMIHFSGERDLQLMYEIYYNFLGHYTRLSNKSVDQLLNKTMNISFSKPTLLQQAFTKVFQVLRNHEYLGYFPHYKTTQKAANLAHRVNKNPQFYKLIQSKVLIKLDGETVKNIYNTIKDFKDLMRFTNIICYRFNHGVIQNLTKQQLIQQITSGIKRTKNIKFIKKNDQYQKFVQGFENPTIQTAIAWIVVKNKHDKAAQIIKKFDQKQQKIKQFSQLVSKLHASKEDANIRGKLQELLQNTQHQRLFKS